MLSVIFFMVGIFGAKAQNNPVTSGGLVSGSGGSISFSIGQVNHITLDGPGGSVFMGQQRPREIEDNRSLVPNFEAVVFPNPTVSIVNFKVPSHQNIENISLQLHNMHGEIVLHKEVDTDQTAIDISGLPIGIYILKAVDNSGNVVQSFKIIKAI